MRLVSNLIMTRLLVPEAFGLMALVFVVIQGMQMLSDLGLGPSVIQNRRGDERSFLNTAWTLQIIRGVVIWSCLTLLAFPAAAWYGEPRLRFLVPVVGLTAIISGFDSTARFTVNRHLALGKLTLFDLCSQAIAIVVMLTLASFHATIWALVAGALVGALMKMCFSHFLIAGPGNRLQLDRDSVRAIVGFGKWIFLSSAVSFFACQADRLIFPKLITFSMLGVYAIAYMLSQFPDQLIMSLSGRVIFPALSQRKHLPREELRALIQRNRRPFLFAVALPLALLACFGDVLVRFLYDERYHAAGGMLSILALGLWPRMLTNTIAPVLLAVGQPRYFAYAATMRLVWVCVGVPVAFAGWGFFGAIVAVASGSLVEYAVEAYGLWRQDLFTPRQDSVTSLVWLALVAAVLVFRTSIGLAHPFTVLF